MLTSKKNRFNCLHLSFAAVIVVTVVLFVGSRHFKPTGNVSDALSEVYHKLDGHIPLASPARGSYQALLADRGTLENPVSKYAYAVLMTATEKEDAGEEDPEENQYMTSIRLLVYQLLHDPETRTTRSIPVVVVVSPKVSHWRRKQLEDEGAWVKEFPAIQLDTMKHIVRPRWRHVMNKLNVWRLTQFDKILLLDADVVFFKPVEDVFEEPETDVRVNLGMQNQTMEDEGPQPQRYLFAADSGPVGKEGHKWPAQRLSNLDAGFMVLRPSEEVLSHYLKVAAIDGRTPMLAPENNLFEYIHRADGNMPWSRVKDTWIMNHGVYSDYVNGIHCMHKKWFKPYPDDLRLEHLLQSYRWRMYGYWGH